MIYNMREVQAHIILILNKKMARKHKVDEVIRSLSKKKDCKIDGTVIYILNGNITPKQNDLGNGSNGRIDFLVNHQGYTKISVSEFPKR